LSRYHAYLKKAVAILEAYKGQEPFSVFIKQQFSLDRKMGSTDRKSVRHYCYCYFRLGKALPEASTTDRILWGLILCGSGNDPLLALEHPTVNTAVEEGSLLEKRTQLLPQVFPYNELLSASLTNSAWALSIWEQPSLFIRMRPGSEEPVMEALQRQSIAFEKVGAHTLSLPSATSLSNWPGLNRDFVIQDLSSQRVASLLSLLPEPAKKKMWDCCAGSGGKSILAIDVLGPLSLSVSDKRETILRQLKQRFAQAGVIDYRSYELDLTRSLPASFTDRFPFIWADVPCSGSGTWSRTPEQLYYFEASTLDQYRHLQQTILRTAITRLQPGGYLLYSTCSVFACENEQQVTWLEEQLGLRCVQQQLFNGAAEKADTLFAALLQKPD